MIFCMLMPNLATTEILSQTTSSYQTQKECKDVFQSMARLSVETVLPAVAKDINVVEHNLSNLFQIQIFYTEKDKRILTSLTCFKDGKGEIISETVD